MTRKKVIDPVVLARTDPRQTSLYGVGHELELRQEEVPAKPAPKSGS